LQRIVDLRNQPPTDHVVLREGAEDSYRFRQPLNPRAVAFISCVNDEAQYRTCLRYIDALEIPSGYTLEKIAVLGATSMAEGYQRAMEASAARYKIYVHQDTYVIHQGLLPEFLHLFRTFPRLGMVGVLGATQLPASGLWWVNNSRNCYGRVWEYYHPAGFPASLFAKGVLHFSRYRSFVSDYMPVAVVDGIFMATQYDIPWISPVGGFMLYDQVHSLEFVRAGLEVGVARQEAIWCLHWGPPQERSGAQRRLREIELDRRAAEFRKHYRKWIGVPAQALYDEFRRPAGSLSMVAGEL